MFYSKIRLAGVALVSGLLAASAAHADGDPVAGAKVFKKCAACHAVDGKNKVGPHLDGIIGRPVASVEDYKYSKAMEEHAAEVPEWTEEALADYLHKPKAVVPKTKMAFVGLKKDEDVANVIAYLKDPAAAE
ncbi:MAG: cytochrome c family protein [Rhizobiales bacterium]|nr:cytochrome c family protein [Hyphomicrobiales bacterium]MBA69275.1 cytochrome c family protein [Hyphomicrobiales bacterium]|tara:strand:- start:426 stop:821 length:396 start_codon:yes stop_codon:yes gene_type:complete